MTIRKATKADFPKIAAIYEYAREQMRKNGNPDQWGTSRPSDSTVKNDIENGISYVIADECEIYGVFAFFVADDPTYEVIWDGGWKSDGRYGVIHRIASSGKIGGIVKTAVDFAAKQCSHLRADTHEKNAIMQHALEKCGFVRCGMIYTDDGTERIAYELI